MLCRKSKVYHLRFTHEISHLHERVELARLVYYIQVYGLHTRIHLKILSKGLAMGIKLEYWPFLTVLDCLGKPGYPKKTPPKLGEKCNLHSVKHPTQNGNQTRNFKLWGSHQWNACVCHMLNNTQLGRRHKSTEVLCCKSMLFKTHCPGSKHLLDQLALIFKDIVWLCKHIECFCFMN